VTRWLVAYDDSVVEDDNPAHAAERHAEQMQLSFGATVYVIDLDSIIGTDRCFRMQLGAFEIEPEPAA
jgi:hypothetical protein